MLVTSPSGTWDSEMGRECSISLVRKLHSLWQSGLELHPFCRPGGRGSDAALASEFVVPGIVRGMRPVFLSV